MRLGDITYYAERSRSSPPWQISTISYNRWLPRSSRWNNSHQSAWRYNMPIAYAYPRVAEQFLSFLESER